MHEDGAESHVLGSGLELRGVPAWAPDGKSIVCAVEQNGTPRLYDIPLNGSAPTQLISEYSLDPSWSPDGKFLLYSGADVGTTFPLRAAFATVVPTRYAAWYSHAVHVASRSFATRTRYWFCADRLSQGLLACRSRQQTPSIRSLPFLMISRSEILTSRPMDARSRSIACKPIQIWY